MTYPENIESKIGFDAVRRMVAARCSSPLGRACVDAMAFTDDFGTVSRLLGETAELKSILEGDNDFPSGDIRDLTDRLKAVRPDGTHLSTSELTDLRVSMTTMAELAAYFAKRRDEDGSTPYPLLDAVAGGLSVFPALVSAIDRVVDRWGNVKDNASPQLAEIRKTLNSMNGRVNTVMRRVMAAAVRDGIIEADTSPSMRDGRLVLPVAPMHKRRVPGIVHDESATGKTVFIEPAEVVEVNNHIRELRIEEHREEIRILVALTAELRPNIGTLIDSYGVLGTFDFIRAKAMLAVDIDATLPHLSASTEVEWYHACHPVLRESLERQGKQVVPLDIVLTPERRLLLISGPNAGGKSVTLKTVAIVQYMLQCGLLPPVYDNSHCGLFADIFIDIGDDQSIEDDLSTYSSHLRNMKFFVNRGSARSLILIDEFGAGTEPQIGGAIAQALLAEFNARGMWGVVTTHFQNLKKFADETPGLVNGSMLYDRQAMRPLFALSIGHPGSSFAIEIARKTGLPESIIQAASEIVGSDYVNMDKYLLDIARDRRYWENKRRDIREKEKRVEQVLERYQDDAEALRRRRNEIIGEARDEARRILEGSNAAIERAIHDIRRSQADREKTLEARRRLADERRELTREDNGEHPAIARAPKRKGQQTKPKQAASESVKPRAIAPGDHVQLDGAGTVGTVEEIRGKQATVIFGQIRTTVKVDRLSPTLKQPSSGARQQASFISAATTDDSRERQLKFKTEIDLRGMRVDEALQAVTYYIDDAIQFNAGRVRILHGTGTGALRQSIRQYLATVPAVRHFADEDIRFGGAGITVVEF